MAAVPSIGRASLVEASGVAPEAAAAHELYQRHAAKIHGYCLHRLGSREDAEDAVQTTFMNAFRALGRGVVPEAEEAWLYKIAENVCLSRHRSSWRRGRIESPADPELVEHVVPAPERPADELIGLGDALADMPEQQRRAILLREWQGLSYREIAHELELSQSAVETLIFRARRSLAQGLEEPVAPRRRLRRVLHALDLAPVVAALKTLLAGGAAAKATAAAVAVTAVGVTAGAAPMEPAATASAAPVQTRAAATRATPAPRAAVRSVAPVERTVPAVERAAPVRARRVAVRAATPSAPVVERAVPAAKHVVRAPKRAVPASVGQARATRARGAAQKAQPAAAKAVAKPAAPSRPQVNRRRSAAVSHPDQAAKTRPAQTRPVASGQFSTRPVPKGLPPSHVQPASRGQASAPHPGPPTTAGPPPASDPGQSRAAPEHGK